MVSVGSNEGDESGGVGYDKMVIVKGWMDGQDRETDIREIMTLTIIRNL